MTGEVYDALIDCKELCWFYQECSEDVVKIKEDKVIWLFEKLMDKLYGR